MPGHIAQCRIPTFVIRSGPMILSSGHAGGAALDIGAVLITGRFRDDDKS
jgi:hypothetical protein